MNTLKTFLLLLLCIGEQVLFVQTAVAQKTDFETQIEIIEERKKMAKLTRKKVESKVWKDAKKIAKELKKDGWKPMPGAPSLVMQQNDMLLKRYELQGYFPRYILGSGQAVASVSGVARKHALARAKVELASNIGAEVVSLTNDASSNTEYSTTDQETVGKLIDESMTKVQQSIGRTEVIFEAYREINGNTEVLLYICYDGRRAKEDILKIFDEEHKDLREKVKQDLDGTYTK